jgi:hypothetical protein
VIKIASKRRGQPAPPRIIAPMLLEPNKYPDRPWMILLPGEVWPTVLRVREPEYVVWSSLWSDFPEAEIEFDLVADRGGGTDLSWTLWLPEAPTADVVAGLRYRLNYLVNAQLRFEFSQ